MTVNRSLCLGRTRNNGAYAELGISATLVHPREVFKAALLSNAHTIVLSHNHPAGSLSASPDDIETTKQLIAAGKIMGVTVLDHLIVTHNAIYSIRENYPELFS